MKRASFVMRSVLALRALAMIIVMLTATTARADDSGYCGDPNVHDGQDVTWSLTDEDGDNVKETLTISGSGAMKDYDDDTPWYNNRLNIKTVVIEDGVMSIGKDAFYFCEGMTSVTIPSSVTSIGKTAFLGCTGLASVTIPSSVTTIGELAFNRCQSLTSVTIPSSVTTIESYAFSECTGLSSVTIPSSVTSIEERTFLACTSLTSVTIPSSVTNIGKSAFSGCEGLTSVTIPSSVTSIGEDAFHYCTSLSSVTIPSSVTSIEPGVFHNCTSLSSITIPASVTSIGNSAFYGCTSLKSVFMLANSTVDDTSFDFNVQGKKFYVPSGSADNYSYYFYGSDIIEFDGYCGDPDVNEGKNVAWVLTDEDGDSENVKETLTIVGTGAMANYEYHNFPWYNNIASIKAGVIGNGVTSIGDYAFCECTGLTSITIPSSVTSIGNSAFDECTSLALVTIPSNVSSIGEWAFARCAKLTSVDISSSVMSIGKCAFYDCAGLETITVDEGNTKYDSRYGCNAIIDTDGKKLITGCKNTVIPNGVESIEIGAFYDCVGLTSVTIPSSVESIGIEAFSGCTGLTSIAIPSSVTSIGDYAFNYCTGLTSVTISTGVTSIGTYAYSLCTSLTSISIPSSVTSIESNAFYGCTNLTEVYCYADPDHLTWNDYNCNDFIYDDENPTKTTVCHVACSKLATFLSKWSRGSTGNGGTDVNVIFVGDGIATDGYDYVVGTVTYGSGTAPEGVKAFLPVAYDLSTATVTLAEIERAGAPKGMPVIYGSAKVDEKMPDLFFLNYVADDSDDDKAIQDNYDSKAKAMSEHFVITDGKDNLSKILDGIDGVTASDAIFFVLANGKFTRVSVSADDLDKEANPAKPGLLLFVLSKWEYMNMGSASSGSTNAARSIGIGEGGATAIDNGKLIIDNWAGAQWYDLQGRKIAEPTRKGLYIRNGVKVVVK